MRIDLKVGLDVINSYKRLAYTPWHAIAEFIDNSTQSYFDSKLVLDQAYKAEQGGLLVSVVYSKEDDILRIVDNSIGMSFEELQDALTVALPPKNTSGRSKYGMGLKTAACWLGNLWTVRTKKLGETVEHSVTVDVPKIARGDSDLSYGAIDGKDENLHYTIVEIHKHNRTFAARTLGKIKEYLRSMYRMDFRNKVQCTVSVIYLQ